MQIKLCARCKKRPATVFITKVENNEQKHEGLCVFCARALGIKQVDEIMNRFGISDEELENMEKVFDDMALMSDEDAENIDEDGSPTIDFAKLMKNGGFEFMQGPSEEAPKKDKKGKNNQTGKKPERKHLTTFCHNLTQDALNGKLDKIIGRERELERVIQILSRRQKNNP
jgi:ATP-dependent Clp protease ATP-binding subunit ClpB